VHQQRLILHPKAQLTHCTSQFLQESAASTEHDEPAVPRGSSGAQPKKKSDAVCPTKKASHVSQSKKASAPEQSQCDAACACAETHSDQCTSSLMLLKFFFDSSDKAVLLLCHPRLLLFSMIQQLASTAQSLRTRPWMTAATLKAATWQKLHPGLPSAACLVATRLLVKATRWAKGIQFASV
jgi:hypothetical protein